MSFRFLNEKKLRNGNSALVIVESDGRAMIEFMYLEWHKISRTYWKLIEINGIERFTSNSTSVYGGFNTTGSKTKLIDRITAVIDKIKSKAIKNKFKSIYRVKTPNLDRAVSYNESEIYNYHDDVLEVPEITQALHHMDIFGDEYENSMFIVFEKPLFKNSNNFGDMKTIQRKQLKSNSMKKSPVKKTSLTKSCKQMTGDVKKMGKQFSKNFKKLI